jgi:hypothetical protein
MRGTLNVIFVTYVCQTTIGGGGGRGGGGVLDFGFIFSPTLLLSFLQYARI